jgi:6-phosphogluconolactonase (cycloisomerase 2 family)
MQRRLPRFVGSIGFFLASAFLLVLLPFANPLIASAYGPDAAGNGGVINHGKSLTRPAVGASFSTDAKGTHYIYVNNGSAPNSVSGYKLTKKGLTPLPGSPYATGGTGGGSGYGGNQIAISPDHKCVFASDDGSGTFNSFQINSDGSLTLVTHATVEAANVQGIAASPKGGVVFVVMFNGYSSGPVDSFSVNSGCAMTEAQHSDINNAMGDVAVSPDGTELFVSSYIGGFINTYSISGTSFTLQHTNSANPPSPGGLAVNGTTLFAGNAGPTETDAYTYNSSGVLTALPGSPASDPQGSNSAQVWYDSKDNQLISSEQSSNSFGLYAVKNGTYTFLAHFAGTGVEPTAMVQIGRTLIVTNDGSGSISVYKVKPGKLTFKKTIPLPVLGSPNGIAGF